MTSDEIILVNPSSILISTKDRLVSLKTPFKAVCLISINYIKEGEIKSIWGVYADQEHKILYLIDKKLFPYRFFHVLA